MICMSNLGYHGMFKLISILVISINRNQVTSYVKIMYVSHDTINQVTRIFKIIIISLCPRVYHVYHVLCAQVLHV